jgi:hypothetical protein
VRNKNIVTCKAFLGKELLDYNVQRVYGGRVTRATEGVEEMNGGQSNCLLQSHVNLVRRRREMELLERNTYLSYKPSLQPTLTLFVSTMKVGRCTILRNVCNRLQAYIQNNTASICRILYMYFGILKSCQSAFSVIFFWLITKLQHGVVFSISANRPAARA